jgi:hypothetical protein
LKKEKINYERTVSIKEVVPLSSEGASLIPPPPRRAVRKVKAPLTTPSADAPVPSSPSGHVSDFSFFFIIIHTRVAPEPIVGWLQPSIGFDNLVIYYSFHYRSLFRLQ